MQYILYALLIWFLYNFIFKLVIPVYRASRRIKKGFREMHEKASRQQAGTQSTASGNTSSGSSYFSGKQSSPVGKPEDYIEFEEVK